MGMGARRMNMKNYQRTFPDIFRRDAREWSFLCAPFYRLFFCVHLNREKLPPSLAPSHLLLCTTRAPSSEFKKLLVCHSSSPFVWDVESEAEKKGWKVKGQWSVDDAAIKRNATKRSSRLLWALLWWNFTFWSSIEVVKRRRGPTVLSIPFWCCLNRLPQPFFSFSSRPLFSSPSSRRTK